MNDTRRPANHQAPQALSDKIHADVEVDALYAHIPFCFHKCHYCDFYSIVTAGHEAGPGSMHQRFTEALIGEMERWAQRIELQPRTIFVGGGTPTMLETEHWASWLERMDRAGVLGRVREFTVEANPETVSQALVTLLAGGGVNRVSIGAQSFQPQLLRTLERHHDPASVRRAVDLVRAAGIEELNLDLIFAVPGQTLAQLDDDLDAALACEPTHLACYGLTFEPGTALTVKQQQGRVSPMAEARQNEMYEHLLNRLDAAGFEQYEISNWARRGPIPSKHADHRSAHNLHYWHNDNWIGIGPAAASHVDGTRWRNLPHLGQYLAGAPIPPITDHEQLDAHGRAGEQLMLGLRLREGVDRAWFESHFPHRQPKTDQLQSHGLLERTATHYRLTHQGLFLADAVIAELM